MTAIDEVIGQNKPKSDPLLIGSVKSNLGHIEPVSGLVSLAKVLICLQSKADKLHDYFIILAMESGLIPPNLHFKNCKDLKAILEGRLKVVINLTPWRGKYAGIDNFGFDGANIHVLLKKHAKEKINNGAPDDDLPRLDIVSGRTEDAVDGMLKDVMHFDDDNFFTYCLYNPNI